MFALQSLDRSIPLDSWRLLRMRSDTTPAAVVHSRPSEILPGFAELWWYIFLASEPSPEICQAWHGRFYAALEAESSSRSLSVLRRNVIMKPLTPVVARSASRNHATTDLRSLRGDVQELATQGE